MAIIKTINFTDFVQAFRALDRQDQFSYEALQALFDYYDDESMGDTDLDVIAICCEWAEYTADELQEQFGHLGDFDTEEELLDELDSQTFVLRLSDDYLVHEF